MEKLKSLYLKSCQKMGTAFVAPTELQGRLVLFAVGLGLLSLGTADLAFAQTDLVIDSGGKIASIVDAILLFIEGPFGALIMVIAGIGAIVSSAFGAYRAALGLLAVAIGCFILRSLVKTFFPQSGVNI